MAATSSSSVQRRVPSVLRASRTRRRPCRAQWRTSAPCWASVTRISYKNADTSPPLRTLRRRPASAGEGYRASLPTSIVQSHGGVCGWGPGRGSGAGRTGPRGGSTSLGGRVESICTIACGSSGASRQGTVVGGGGARDGGAGRRDPAHRIGGGAGAVGRRRRGSSVEPAPQSRGDPKARAPAARSSSDGCHGGGGPYHPWDHRGPFFFGPVEGGAASGSEAGGRLRGDV